MAELRSPASELPDAYAHRVQPSITRTALLSIEQAAPGRTLRASLPTVSAGNPESVGIRRIRADHRCIGPRLVAENASRPVGAQGKTVRGAADELGVCPIRQTVEPLGHQCSLGVNA